MTATPPLLSVILVTQGSFEALRRVVGHLRAQSVRDRIEIVLVAPSEAGLEADPAALEGFHGVRLVATGPIEVAGVAVAAGACVAFAEIVVYVEEHSFPAPGWAEALIRAHEGPWASVGRCCPASFRPWRWGWSRARRAKCSGTRSARGTRRAPDSPSSSIA